jgi:mycothiol synthase
VVTPPLTWRPLSLDDARAWSDLMAAVEEADGFGELFTDADLPDELSGPTLDLARDTWAVLDGVGLVAFGILGTPSAPADGVWSFDAWGGVRPSARRQGIGRELLARMVARADAVASERFPGATVRVRAQALDRTEDRRALLEAAGFEIARWFFDMERDLAQPVEEPQLPPDLALVPFDPARDEEVRRAHNESFAQHWGSAERSPEVWAQWFTGNRHFRPDLSFLVLDGGEVAAYALCQRYPEEDEALGHTAAWLGQLGTRPPWRGRGLGTALLRRTVQAMQADGLEVAALAVDSENGTGALALYEREAFRTTRRKIAYVREISSQT